MTVPVRIHAVVPAAGRGARLGAAWPKTFVPLGDGTCAWSRVFAAVRPSVDRVTAVLSPGGRSFVEARGWPGAAAPDAVVIQDSPTGMGDAVLLGLADGSERDAVLVVWGDQAGVSPTTVRRVCEALRRAERPTVVLPWWCTDAPYVAWSLETDGRLAHVRRRRDGDEMPARGHSDVGVFGLRGDELRPLWHRHLTDVGPSPETGERDFLPFLPWLSRTAGWSVETLDAGDADEARGLNVPADLDAHGRPRAAPR